MKVLFLLVTFYSFQYARAQKRTFMRVTQIGTSNFIRGFYAGVIDSAIIIFNHQHNDTISYSRIQEIKTKRSGGHNLLLGVATGIIAGTITGLITYKKPEQQPNDPNCSLCPFFHDTFSFTQGEAAAAGGLTGGLAGLATGGIISLARKKKTFLVAGNFINWVLVKKIIETLPAHRIE